MWYWTPVDINVDDHSLNNNPNTFTDLESLKSTIIFDPPKNL